MPISKKRWLCASLSVLMSIQLTGVLPVSAVSPSVAPTEQEQVAQTVTAKQWSPVDIDISGQVPEGSNPYMDTAGKVKATFTHDDGTTIQISAFYRDNGIWTLRFTPNKPGTWHYTVFYDADDSYVYDADYYKDQIQPKDDSKQYAEAYKGIFDGVSGTVICTKNDNPNMHGGVKQNPDYPDHFVYEDGTDYFLMGYEVDWLGIMAAGGHENGLEKAKKLIDQLAEAGYNEVLMNAFGWDTSWSKGNAIIAEGTKNPPVQLNVEGYDFGPSPTLPWKNSFGEGSNPELSLDTYILENKEYIDFTQMNEEYWDAFDQIIQYMNEKGITAHIFWKVYNKSVIWDTTTGTGNNSDSNSYMTYADTMYARYFMDRYSAYNVIIDMSKESYKLTPGNHGDLNNMSYPNLPSDMSKTFYMDTILKIFNDRNSYGRIITIHDFDQYYRYLRDTYGNNYNTYVQLFTDQDHQWPESENSNGWTTNTQPYGKNGFMYDVTLKFKTDYPNIPYYNCESNYQWDNGAGHGWTYNSPAEHETPEYAILDYCNLTMAGAYFAHYYTTHAWDVVKYNEMPEHTEYMTNLKAFITQTVGADTWAAMEPNNAIINETTTQENRHAMAIPGSNYLIYLGYAEEIAPGDASKPELVNKEIPEEFSDITSVIVDFTKVTTPLQGIWYNVLTGETVDAGLVTANGEQTFNWPEFTQTVKEVSGTEKQGPGESVFLYFYPATQYSVSVETEGNGTASASLSSATEGTQITLTATPDSGYHFKEWQVVSGNVTISNNQFTMPASDVTVKAIFEKDASSGGGSSSGGSSSGSTTETEHNPDGSTTTTVTKPDGTVIETTKQPDGSTTQVVTKPDGSSTTTVDNKDGSSSTTVSKNGKVESEVKLPSAVVEDAAEKNEVVALPIPELPVISDKQDAPTVTVDLPSNTSAKVEIPVEDVTPGTVAVIVKADGTEEVIKTTLTTENGVAVTLSDGDTVKIVDNSKDFNDVAANYWGNQYIDFATSRELFSGTSATTFSPEAVMTRGMIVTVLASYDGADTSASVGEAWYAAGQQWAMENGISDGSNMNGNLNREQLALMLWNYAGKPAPSGNLSRFTDAHDISDWAAQAMAWAVENGLISGMGDGSLAPQGLATRAQVATIMSRFVALTA